MYDPTVGSWISEDPIGFAAGDANLARYVGGMPTIYVDPSGLDVDWTIDPDWPTGNDPGSGSTLGPIINPSPGSGITIPPGLLDPPKESPKDKLPPGLFNPTGLPGYFLPGSTMECRIIPKFDLDYDFDDPFRPSIDLHYKKTDIKFIIRY